MDNTSLIQELLKELLIQAPMFLAITLGLLVSIRFWRVAPAASRWCVAAFLLALVGSAMTIYGSMAEMVFVSERLVPILRAVTYILFLIGVYAGRRMPVAGLTSSQPTLWQPIFEVLRARPWLKGLFRTAFVSTFLLVFVCVVLVSFIKPETYVGTVHVRLKMGDMNSAVTNSAEAMIARQMRTECQMIQSQTILRKVAENPKLDLKERWAAEFHDGEPLTAQETIVLLKHLIDVRPARDADLLEIRCYGDEPNEAAELANAIGESYCGYVSTMSGASRSADDDKPQADFAEIVDRAAPNAIPVRPNKPLDMMLGFWGALWLAVAAGLFVVWISIKFENKQTALSGSGDGKEVGREWVRAQNNLGAALRDQARRSEGIEALRLLDESAAAYRAVADDKMREHFPESWAMAQNNLGVLLRDRAEWSQPDVAVILLKEAVGAHRAALEVYACAQYPRYWTTTQNNLSAALRDQAKRSQGSEAIRLLSEAVAAGRAALET